jgi:hypothetical protein
VPEGSRCNVFQTLIYRRKKGKGKDKSSQDTDIREAEAQTLIQTNNAPENEVVPRRSIPQPTTKQPANITAQSEPRRSTRNQIKETTQSAPLQTGEGNRRSARISSAQVLGN